jgi:xylitol oxidase
MDLTGTRTPAEATGVTGRLTNWAGNIHFGATRLHRPETLDQLRTLVARATRIRALGTGHSFNPIADSPGELVTVAGLPPLLEIDRDRHEVQVAAGMRYGDLAVHLHRAGYALHNLGSLPHISVAGACATGTHGSGWRLGNLATAVRGLELVTAGGDLVSLRWDTDPQHLPAAVVSLGALGVVTTLTLAIEPTYDVEQYVYLDLPAHRLANDWAEVLAAGYSVSLFTDWSRPGIDQVWVKRRPDREGPWRGGPVWLDAPLADGPRHPVPGMSPEHCTEQLGIPGPWHHRLPHFQFGFTPSSGRELQSEFFIPRSATPEAVAALARIGDRIAPVTQVCEIRTVAADDLWLSPAYRRDSTALHFTWVDDVRAVQPVLAEVERRLRPYDARPHWGKLFGTDRETLRRLYPRLDDFVALAGEYDPAGKFRNALLDDRLFG